MAFLILMNPCTNLRLLDGQGSDAEASKIFFRLSCFLKQQLKVLAHKLEMSQASSFESEAGWCGGPSLSEAVLLLSLPQDRMSPPHHEPHFSSTWLCMYSSCTAVHCWETRLMAKAGVGVLGQAHS